MRNARWGNDFVRLGERLNERLAWQFSHVGFTCTDFSKSDITWEGKKIPRAKSKTWKYSAKALARLRDASAVEDIRAIEFIWEGTDGNLNVGARIVLGCRVPGGDRPCQLTLVAEADILPEERSPRNLTADILLAFEDVIHQEYARVDWRTRLQIHPFAFNEFGHEPDLGSDRNVLFEVFGDSEQYGQLLRLKLREVHWGNLLSEHGGGQRQALMSDIRGLVRDDNVIALEGGRTFFCLPFEPRDSKMYSSNISSWRRRLRDALAPYDIFL